MKKPLSRRPWSLAVAILPLLAVITSVPAEKEPNSKKALPSGFVDVQEIIPGIYADLRYFTDQNFVGKRIDGYLAPRIILTREAAESLARVQADLVPFGLGLKIFDAYRPQRSVNHFMRWTKDLGDTAMKARYYPNVAKEKLLSQGYIAERSSHSRGSTVDLTIVTLSAAENLDMGGGFDFFDPSSRIVDKKSPPAARAHRMLLLNLMLKHGFKSYPREWWHFTLRDEPFPDTYFDFPVQ
jgi:D-alanyl-D-alanine dipeptidase